VNGMLTDDDLARLLEEAAGTFVVPAPDLDVPKQEKRVWQRRWPQAAAAAAVLVAGSLVLSNVGGTGNSPNAARTASSPLAPGEKSVGVQPDALAPVPVPLTAQRQQYSGALSSGGGAATGGTGGGAAAPGDTDAARVVKTGTLSLVVDKGRVSDTVRALNRLVAGFSGYVADSTSDEVGDNPSATLTVRVPASSFSTVIDRVRALKVKVVSATEAGKDITATYADTQAQIQSLRAARDRYLAILARARTIGETLTVQQRVDDVQQQIDRLEGQRRVLADQSDFGTLTISVAEKASAEAFITKEPSGWSKAWDDATHGFTSGVQRLIAGSGRTLLVLICGAVLFLLGRTGWRLARRRLV